MSATHATNSSIQFSQSPQANNSTRSSTDPLEVLAGNLVRTVGAAAAIDYCRNNQWDGVIARINSLTG